MGYSDLFESRRTLFAKCQWWSQKVVPMADGRPDYSKLAYNKNPTGSFYAEETGTLTENARQIGDVRYTAKFVTLSTTDDIMGKLFKDDVVRYDGRFWRVDSITLQREWRRSQFAKKNREGTKVITLRG